MYQVILAKSAEQNLDEIAKYIAVDSYYRALSFTQELIGSFTKKFLFIPVLVQGASIKKAFIILYIKVI